MTFFLCGPDILERNVEMIDNPFWTHFTNSLKKLWQLSLVLHRDVTMEIPIWFIPMLKIDYKQKRFSIGNKLLVMYSAP